MAVTIEHLHRALIRTVCALVLIIPLFSNTPSYSQAGTEIYLFDIAFEGGEMVLSNPVNITNRTGYDNQPFFHPDRAILFYVSADAKGNTDIMEFNYEINKTRKFKETSEREYSPQVTPDKKFVSCIIQRQDGKQDLGKYPIEGGEPVILINNLTVGYHTWAGNNTVVVFTLPQPFALHIINLDSSADSIVARNIGRSLHKIPGEPGVSFIQKTETEEWIVKKFDIKDWANSTIIKSLPGKEHDMAWTSDGKLLMSDEKKIFFAEGKTSAWKEAKFKSDISLKTITRLAVNSSSNKMAIVVNE